MWLTASECFTLLIDFIQRLTRFSSVAHSLRMLDFLKGFHEEIDQIKLWSSQPQKCCSFLTDFIENLARLKSVARSLEILRSLRILFRNWRDYDLWLTASDCFTFLTYSIQKLTRLSSVAHSHRNASLSEKIRLRTWPEYSCGSQLQNALSSQRMLCRNWLD